MSWLFSQALVAEYSADTCSAGEPSAPSSGTPTPRAYLWPDKTTAAWRRFPSGMTCSPLTDDRGEAVLTSFLAAFPAQTSPSQERAQESTDKPAGCGDTWRESLARYDPATSSWKTRQCSLFEDLTESSAIFPTWGMTQDGALFPLKTLARLMTASDFGLEQNSRRGKQQDRQKTAGYVIGATATLCLDVGAITPNGYAETAKNGLTRFIMKNGTVALSAAPEMWLTPQANEDAAGTPRGKMQKMLGNHPLIRGNTPEEWARGTLNPTWVEWLMGWPLGWTDCAALETDKYRQWRRQHGGCLEDRNDNEG